MSGRARIGLGICGILLIGGAWVARKTVPGLLAPESFAAGTPLSDDERLPVLGYFEQEAAPSGPPEIKDPAFFEEQATRTEVLERLAKYAAVAQDDADLAPELLAQFQLREQARVAETPSASLKVEGIETAEAIAVSASGTVVAVATGEQCQLFDIDASGASDAELKIVPRPASAVLRLPGRTGNQLLLDHDGQHLVYLADGGALWTADIESGEAKRIVAQGLKPGELSDCTLLGGGLASGWMVAGTKQGEAILFNLEGAAFKSEGTTWPNQNHQNHPKLLSITCDPAGQIVLAGYENAAIRWFRRQGHSLTVDGGLAGFPGSVQSVTANGPQFAAAGKLFYFICAAPEPGEPIDVEHCSTPRTMHLESQIALSGDGASPRLTLWGECPQITTDRRTVWLYEVDTRTSHMHRPMKSSLQKSAHLRSLAASGALLAAISDGSLHVAQPAGHNTSAPKSFGNIIAQLLEEKRFDEIERCTRYWGAPQRRFTDYQSDWIFCVGQVLQSKDGDHQVREKKLLEWLDADPDSLTAWIALANHYVATAWAARGSEAGHKVTDFGWEMVEQHVPKADLIARSMLANSCEEPALFLLAGGQTGIAGWTHLERKRFGERALELFPDYFDLHTSIAFYRLPRWGGSHSEVLRFIELVADAAEAEQQDAYYAILAASLQKRFHPESGLKPTPVDLDRMHRGMLLPSPVGYNSSEAFYLMLQAAAFKGEIAYAGFYFDQLISEAPYLPASTNRPTFLSLSEWVDGAHTMLVQHLEKVEAEQQAAAEQAGDDPSEALPTAE
ncbi:DUF4034 domain-containing protein [Candidatus Laterigemmans baculatus]|uniref:DUF4034 domain-containing protein n=1 Tax=Candidatus Laterigemmans baculatus TaxID=2770505 RepID=UPI0013DA786C|nr:DUF4034 domain-containing protein [Candidatus Laterigemmans baculatus]